MSLLQQIVSKVESVFTDQWSYVDARVVPETKSIGMGNQGKKLNATVLYADLDESTSLVQKFNNEFAAEVYKVFLYAASRLITDGGGAIRSFDGDRVMGVFLDGRPNTNAAKTALKLKWIVDEVINPKLKKQYPSTDYVLRYTVGIDSTELLAVRGGVRDVNDLAWIGDAANIAAKLNGLSSSTPSWITHRVYEKMADETKYGGNPKRNMWEARSWTQMNDMRVYCSSWRWKVN